MVRHVHIDFETRSEVPIKTRGVWNYAIHQSTQIICCAYAVDEEPPKLLVGAGFPTFPGYSTDWSELTALAKAEDTIFYAHNATFEMRLWEHQLTKYGVPVVPVERWVCTMALAYAFNLPGSLDKVGEALGLSVQKDKRGKQLISLLSVPNKITKTKQPDYIDQFWGKYEDSEYVKISGDRYWNNTPEFMKEFYDYCKTDVEVERLLTKHIPRLVPFERKIWEMDKHMNTRGLKIDLELIDSAEFIFAEHKRRLIPVFKELTGGVNPTQVRQVINWLVEHGVEERKFVRYVTENGVSVRKLSLDAEKIKALLADETIVGDIRTAVEIRKEFSKSSIAKFKSFKDLADADGVLRDYLIYARAVTNRWGGNGAQPQNLPSQGCAKNQELLIHLIKSRNYDLLRVCYPDVSQALSSAIRGVIIARDGHDLIVSDYAAIEARMLMWLVGEEAACEMFKKDEDIYSDMARVIFNDRSITKESNPEARGLGKRAILGCGYGMGHKKFKETCEKYGEHITTELAETAVSAYRNKYLKVRNTWYALNRCAIYAVEHPGTKVLVKETGDRIYYVMQGHYLYCVLPSKRFIAYPFAKVEMVDKDFGDGPVPQQSLTYMKEDSAQNNRWVRVDTYGGKLIENIVQAMARDVMSIGGLNCIQARYYLLLLVHDEAVSEVEETFGSVDELETLLADMPEWAKGCPIKAVDGWREKRYRK